MEACKTLGHVEILCVEILCDVVDADDLHAELAMIDENLCRAELSPADRARQTARRKEIYEALHPESVAQVRQGHIRQGVADANLAPAFTASTAAATGKSERAVQRDAERGAKVIDEVLEMIRGGNIFGVHSEHSKHSEHAESSQEKPRKWPLTSSGGAVILRLSLMQRDREGLQSVEEIHGSMTSERAASIGDAR